MKIDFRIPIIIVLTIILVIMICFYYKDDSANIQSNNSKVVSENSSNSKKTTISSISEISSALSEKIELHATYYLEESYVSENQLVKKGENILKYTNGTYLTAPYDLIITKINIPDTNGQCKNSHYIEVSSNNVLSVSFKVSESKISSISLGDEATIKISALDDKEIEGAVTDISSTASNGKFTVTVEFENNGNIMLGMTANISI